MTDQHVKGAVSTVKGTVNEGVGKLTGDRTQEAKGILQKVLGNIGDRGWSQPILVSVAGVVIVVLVTALFTGAVRMARSSG